MIITKIIYDYLQQNRRITIPGLGTLLSKGEGDAILFSEFMKEDDGVLHKLLVDNGLKEIEAAVLIDRFVFDLRHAVSVGERLSLSGLGYLSSADGKSIIFEFDPTADGTVETKVAEAVVQIIEEETTEESALEEVLEEVAEPEEQLEDEQQEAEEISFQEVEVAPLKRKSGVDFWIIAAIIGLLAAIFALGYGVLVEWKMGNVSFGETVDEIIYNIFVE